MILLILLLTSILITPAFGMHNNYQKEVKINRVTTQTILKKIKGGCIGENTITLLELAEKKDPTNRALQAYIVGKTAYKMMQYAYTFDEFRRIECQACRAHDDEGQQVTEVMKTYWQQKKDPITNSIASKYYQALGFLLMMREPLYPSQLSAACINHDLHSLQLLLQAGCPTHNNNKAVDEQPLVYAAERAAATDDFTLLKSLIRHVPLNATFKHGDKEVTVAEYFQKRWQDILCEHSEKANVCKYIVDLLTN